MKIRFGQMHATVLCQYSAFAEVANAALGGGDDKGGSTGLDGRSDITAAAANGDQAIALVNAALKFG